VELARAVARVLRNNIAVTHKHHFTGASLRRETAESSEKAVGEFKSQILGRSCDHCMLVLPVGPFIRRQGIAEHCERFVNLV
jgi:hypothetical protein